MIDFKLADIKLEKKRDLEKNLSKSFQDIHIFCKNAVLNIYRYLERFYTKKKINNIFLVLHHSLLRMPKFIEIG